MRNPTVGSPVSDDQSGTYVKSDLPFEEDAPAERASMTDPEAAGMPPTVDSPGGPGLPAEPLESAVKRAEDQLREANDRYLRLAADFDNFRKRVARERIELADRAQAAFVIRLLDVLDDLDRLVAADPNGPVALLRQGVEMVDKKLRKELEASGLERTDPVGKRFDPAVAEAVSVVSPPAPDQDHTVSQTFQVGYLFKGALVRPARVQVFSSEGNA